MQDIIIEKPYEFIPPHRGHVLPWLVQKSRIVDWYINRFEGVETHQLLGIDHLRESMRRGHGVILAPNHCRYADPMVMVWIARAAKINMHAMASWHLFQKSRWMRWAMTTMGAFSVYREGVDRQSLDMAVEILVEGSRPLVLFPEGAVFRTNDQLQALLDGVAFIARTAAKRRAKIDETSQVVIHPVAIKYLFHGDLEKTIRPVLDEIEHRLTWVHTDRGSVLQRLGKIIHALLSLKEIEYLGSARPGDMVHRQQALIDHLLQPIELQWLGKQQTGAIIPRVKTLRMKILPELIQGELDPQERTKRWRHLADLYLAQQIASYPSNYLTAPTTEMRVLETVERIEEDLADVARIHRPMEVIIEIGEPIEVSTERGPRGEEDPLMVTLKERLQQMLGRLAGQSRAYT